MPKRIPTDAPLRIDIEEYHAMAHYYAIMHGRNHPNDLHDIAMDALIRAGQTWDESKGVVFATWLIIWVRCMVTRLDRQRKLRTRLPRMRKEMPRGSEPDPSAALDLEDDRIAANAILSKSKLTIRQFDTFVSIAGRGDTHKVAAFEYDAKETTAHYHYKTAVKKIRHARRKYDS